MTDNKNTLKGRPPNNDPVDPIAGSMAGVSRSLTRILAGMSRGGIAGSFSGMAEETAGYPLDLIKTRIQVHANPNVSFINVFKELIQKEGFVGMFRGLSSPLLAAAMASAIQFTTFEKVNLKIETYYPQVSSTVRYLTSGATAGLFQSFVICPVDVIKSRMMIQGMGHGHGGGGGGHGGGGTLALAKSIFKENGIRGFYTGFTATLLRDVPGTAIFFATYVGLKQKLGVEEHGKSHSARDVLAILLAGGLAGSAYRSSTHCFDIAKTLIQTQTTTPKYKGTLDCLRQLVARDGIKGLFRGYIPTVVRSFPANAAGFMVYELVQNI
ncbi:hypothetical protein SAMD00019534_120750, partial [Acytostelium subglobosum LB1]|uniref:hypothetical protein n=1 Tax=Acytostelium subglobosum LB1 TaxID=1410327 RepID=UPI00064491AD